MRKNVQFPGPSNVVGVGERGLYTPTFLLMNILNFLVLTGNTFYYLYPMHLEDIGKTDTEIGYIIGIYSIAAMFARIATGPRIDKIGRRVFVRAGIAVNILCAFLFALPIDATWYLVLIRVIHGIGYSTYFTAIFTWTADYAPPGKTGEALGAFGISGLLTIASGPFIGQKILAFFNGNFIFVFIASILFSLGGLILSIWMKDVHENSPNAVRTDFFGLVKKFDIAKICMIAIIFGTGIGAMFAFITPYIRDFRLGEPSDFFTPYTIASILIRVAIGKISDRGRRIYFLAPGFCVMAVGMSYLCMADRFDIISLVGFALGSAHGVVYPTMNALMIERAGAQNKGSATGIFNASIDLGTLSGASLYGYISDRSGFPFMYSTAGLVIGMGIALFSIMHFSTPSPAKALHLQKTDG